MSIFEHGTFRYYKRISQPDIHIYYDSNVRTELCVACNAIIDLLLHWCDSVQCSACLLASAEKQVVCCASHRQQSRPNGRRNAGFLCPHVYTYVLISSDRPVLQMFLLNYIIFCLATPNLVANLNALKIFISRKD
jgi:hypothetical protein